MTTLLCLAIGLVLALLGSAPAAAQPTDLQGLIDERAVIALVDGVDADVDGKRWPAVRAAFTPEIDVDLSAAGGPSGKCRRRSWSARGKRTCSRRRRVFTCAAITG